MGCSPTSVLSRRTMTYLFLISFENPSFSSYGTKNMGNVLSSATNRYNSRFPDLPNVLFPFNSKTPHIESITHVNVENFLYHLGGTQGTYGSLQPSLFTLPCFLLTPFNDRSSLNKGGGKGNLRFPLLLIQNDLNARGITTICWQDSYCAQFVKILRRYQAPAGCHRPQI